MQQWYPREFSYHCHNNVIRAHCCSVLQTMTSVHNVAAINVGTVTSWPGKQDTEMEALWGNGAPHDVQSPKWASP